jgi:hypothetical protein
MPPRSGVADSQAMDNRRPVSASGQASRAPFMQQRDGLQLARNRRESARAEQVSARPLSFR